MPKVAKLQPSQSRFLLSLAGLGGVALILLLGRMNYTDSARFAFLAWNLLLSVLPLFFAWWLVGSVRSRGWSRWQSVVLAILWILFLPNSFYLITDFVHLRASYEIGLLYDVALFFSFAAAGLVYGLVSLYLVHRVLLEKVSLRISWSIVGTLLMAVSFALYLGRFGRWNSWDVLFRPAGILFDVSDRFINPAAHSTTYQVTVIFFFVIASLYWVLFESALLLEGKRKTKK